MYSHTVEYVISYEYVIDTRSDFAITHLSTNSDSLVSII